MKILLKSFCVLALGFGAVLTDSLAQTDGAATLEATLLDYNGSGTKHYAVAWVTTEGGTFIKSLRKQGPGSWTSSQWSAHCTTWNNARAGSTVLDGYTSATAQNYTGTNSPVVLTWNCRDTNNQLVPDSNYKFWVQYAEDQNVQGPVTTAGLLWTKGPTGATNSYADQAGNFVGKRVTWVPLTAPPVAPTITSAVRTDGNNLVLGGSGPANGTCHLLISGNLTQPLAQWTSIATNGFDGNGHVAFTNALDTAATQQFFELRLP